MVNTLQEQIDEIRAIGSNYYFHLFSFFRGKDAKLLAEYSFRSDIGDLVDDFVALCPSSERGEAPIDKTLYQKEVAGIESQLAQSQPLRTGRPEIDEEEGRESIRPKK